MKKILLSLMILFIPTLNLSANERVLNIALTTNYVFRGLTQTNDNSALQASYTVSQAKNSGWYVGIFGSNVAKGAEIDLYAGFKATTGRNNDLTFEVGAIEYLYTDSNFAPFSHEFFLGLSSKVSYLKYYFGENESRYIDLGTSLHLASKAYLDLHYGRTAGPGLGTNDFSAAFRLDMNSLTLSATITYEDKTVNKETEVFFTIAKDF